MIEILPTISCRILLATAIALLLTGCAGLQQAPERVLPEMLAPEQWQSAASGATRVLPQSWLQRLDDPLLKHLVAESMKANPQLQRTKALVAEGDAQAIVAGAEQQPNLNASLQAGRSDSGVVISDQFSLGLNFGWELDLWNKLSDSARAAEIDRQALWRDYQSARLSLAANVTKGWFIGVEANQQLQLSQNLVRVLADRLEVLEEGYRAGIVAALDIHLARANLAGERSRVATRQQTLGRAVRNLELLLGRYPANRLTIADQLPVLPESIPAGLPSELLARRYDIRAAALRTESAWARLSRSHKDRFPSFSLTGSLGARSSEYDQLLQGSAVVWSLLAGVAQPLLDGNRLEALEAKSLAQAQQREAVYRDTVLQAFAEVEEALQQEQQLLRLVEQLELSVSESDQAEVLAAEQYRAGLVEYITLLESQRRAFDARSTYIQARNQQLQNRIDLYLALGGDFLIGPHEAAVADDSLSDAGAARPEREREQKQEQKRASGSASKPSAATLANQTLSSQKTH